MNNYPVKVSRTKKGGFIAAIQNERGDTLRELYQHDPSLSEKMNLFLLKKTVEIFVWTDKIEDPSEPPSLQTHDISGSGG